MERISLGPGRGVRAPGEPGAGLSINLSRIMADPRLTNQALESLALLLAALLVSTFLLAPGQSSLAMGLEVLGIGGPIWVGCALLHLLDLRAVGARWRRAARTQATISQIGTLPWLVAGIAAVLGLPGCESVARRDLRMAGGARTHGDTGEAVIR